jgi:hypothetical protein
VIETRVGVIDAVIALPGHLDYRVIRMIPCVIAP